jgi:hypothetical protein
VVVFGEGYALSSSWIDGLEDGKTVALWSFCHQRRSLECTRLRLNLGSSLSDFYYAFPSIFL